MTRLTDNEYINANNVSKISKYFDIHDNIYRYSATLVGGVRVSITAEVFEYLKTHSGSIIIDDFTTTNLTATNADIEDLDAETAKVTDKLTVGTIEDVENEIIKLRDFSDVKDVVGTKADLLAYDTSKLGDKDIIEVLQDESEDNANTLYRWNKTDSSWSLVGKVGPYYTKNEAVEKAINITYAELKSKRDNNFLKAGQWYRITDFITTTSDPESRSLGYAYDILVLAEDTNILSEQARAAHHTGDTHFANSKVECWAIWYCLDNDTTRFNWADTTNGKGVVYRMIDEWNNDLWYDYKNIQFKRYKIATVKYPDANGGVVDKYLGFKGISWSGRTELWTIDENDYKWFWTFHNTSKTDTEIGSELSTDVTLGTYFANNNIMGQYLADTPLYRGVLGLGNNVFVGKHVNDMFWQHGNNNNTIYARHDSVDSSGATVSLDIGINNIRSLFRNNIIYANMNHTFIGSCFQYNLIGDTCVNGGFSWNILEESHFDNNAIGDGFYRNRTFGSFGQNVITGLCAFNDINDTFKKNTIGKSFAYNKIGPAFQENTVGDNFIYNVCGTWVYKNTIGNNCKWNTLSNEFKNNVVGNDFNCNAFMTYTQACTFGDSFKYNSSLNNLRSVTFGINCQGLNFIGITNNCEICGEVYYVTFHGRLSFVKITRDGEPTDTNSLNRLQIVDTITGASATNMLELNITEMGIEEDSTAKTLRLDETGILILSTVKIIGGLPVTKGKYKDPINDTEWHDFSTTTTTITIPAGTTTYQLSDNLIYKIAGETVEFTPTYPSDIIDDYCVELRFYVGSVPATITFGENDTVEGFDCENNLFMPMAFTYYKFHISKGETGMNIIVARG